MASPSLASSPRSHTVRIAVRLLLIVLLLIVAVAGGTALWFWRTATAALPQVDGTVRVAGLTAPVTVVRDAQGVPHITAASEADLFFAQGYVTAQDRLWQMDMARRFAAGGLAEILGPPFVKHDREQRILGIRQVAERSMAAASARDRGHFEAYAKGVNALIAAQRGRLPIEFRMLHYEPRQWTALDSMLCGINLAQSLNHGLYLREIYRGRVTETIGAELAADLYPNSSWRDHPPGAEDDKFDVEGATPGAEEKSTTKTRRHVEGDRRLAVGDWLEATAQPLFNANSQEPTAVGSNNWVVSGAHTASGKPILANDMHLINTVPNTWYEAQLRITSQGFDVVGVTLPGLPYVIMGHNARVAWGFTNLGPAVEDVYVENLNSRGEYEAPDGWHPLLKRDETVKVKGEADVHVEVRATRHGPVATELITGETRPLALRWVIYEQPLTAPFFDVNAATDWASFRAAFAQFNGPSQNVVYADVDGHIGYQATGKIPIRTSGDGSVPVSGSDNAHEWTGYVPFERLPSVFDPPSGVIATANARITPDKYPFALSNEWGSAYRTERIYRVLHAKPQLTAQDMLALQNDVESGFDRFCAERFVYAVDHAKNASARARAAADQMRGWNGIVSRDAVAPSVVAATRRELWRKLLAPRGVSTSGLIAVTVPLPADAKTPPQYQWFSSTVALENLLMKQPARWLPKGVASWDELLVAAVEAAVAAPDAPKELATWKWGPAHPIDLNHPLFGQIPLLRGMSGPGVQAQSGNGTTVKQVGRMLGPSERMATDFADLDASYLNIVTGESGQLFSEHYNDQWKSWYEGTFSFPLAFTPGAVEKSAKHRLTLTP